MVAKQYQLNPLKVADPRSRLLNDVPLLSDSPEDHTGALTICNKCGDDEE